MSSAGGARDDGAPSASPMPRAPIEPFPCALGREMTCLQHMAAHRQTSKVGSISHTLLTGGTYFVTDDRLDEIYSCIADDVARLGNAPAICEIHSANFPMYADFDFEAPAAVLADEFIHRLATTANREILRFFPGGTLPLCIVCRKRRGGTLAASGGYKHGLHLHWPRVIVQIEHAEYLRLGIICGLAGQLWKEEMGVAQPDWEAIVDKAVYLNSDRAGGLRMVYAVKARRCRNCTPQDNWCTECGAQNNHYVVDDNVYVFHARYRGDERIDPGGMDHPTRVLRLLKATTVRCPPSTALTPGFVAPPGLANPSGSITAGGGRGRGKRKADDTRLLPPKFRTAPAVEDRAVHAAVRRLLLTFDPQYAEPALMIRMDGRGGGRVTLSGLNASFCLNLGGHHKSARVYMELSETPPQYRMRCWCKCNVARRTGGTCGEFSMVKRLSTADVALLFPRAVPAASASDGGLWDDVAALERAITAQQHEADRAAGQ